MNNQNFGSSEHEVSEQFMMHRMGDDQVETMYPTSAQTHATRVSTMYPGSLTCTCTCVRRTHSYSDGKSAQSGNSIHKVCRYFDDAI